MSRIIFRKKSWKLFNSSVFIVRMLKGFGAKSSKWLHPYLRFYITSCTVFYHWQTWSSCCIFSPFPHTLPKTLVCLHGVSGSPAGMSHETYCSHQVFFSGLILVKTLSLKSQSFLASQHLPQQVSCFWCFWKRFHNYFLYHYQHFP